MSGGREGGGVQRIEALSFPRGDLYVGENGCGELTLPEAITRACGIHIRHGDQRTRYGYSPHGGELHRFVEREWANGVVIAADASSGTAVRIGKLEPPHTGRLDAGGALP